MASTDQQKIADALDGLDLFNSFEYAELEAISQYVTHVSKPKGSVVFNEGDPGSYMLILLEGRLSIVKGADKGTQLLCHEGRGRLVGEMALLDHEPRSASCMADTDCEMLWMDADNLARMAKDKPLLAYKFMFSMAKLLSRRLRKTSGVLVDYLSS